MRRKLPAKPSSPIGIGLATVIVAVCSWSTGVLAEVTSLDNGRTIKVVGSFAGKKPGQTATDLSGIACGAPVGEASRRCLVVNDENRSAQYVRIGPDGTMEVGAEIDLIGTEPPVAVLGVRPAPPCPKQGQFGEFDGEGVAFDGEFFYVAGSHGCSRNKGEFRLSSFMLARLRSDRPGGAVELTYRLGDILRRAETVGAYFGQDLRDSDGLNIEGIAVLGGELFAGLRAPSVRGQAYIVAARLEELFAQATDPVTSDPTVYSVPLGENAGVRDLAALPDGRLLILAGPAQEQVDVPYRLLRVDIRGGGAPEALATLPSLRNKDGNPAKAEAVVVLDSASDLRLLVMFDGLPNGGPREYRVPLRK